ncbi:MAG: hypothetical protein COZ36_10305 [Piscirickettsiaceae bacterium CG_4_10_14_3_um_filter_44_349]|nr:DUF3494 domain-containing protein [Thiomicrospira sp.]PIX78225.1 MAG: hypothetical protein COZ36_10305 [Piscirickettsiaceae bacterium CG_4_10_14_3_um_filter_44_349]PIZ73579.1 MAG: hypothetical protein COY08_05760 [Piscirickettsiaceae bacterium CG_4_10_14_0_2_um_filter_44_336]NCN67154.1 DUF3494 domain-containing protein [Thiomicrospira sp.]NCO13082.1 DUF3494 domain-containing protein [Thiomicrospira sp.]
MTHFKKYTGHSFWLTGLMLTVLLTGCGGGNEVPTAVEDTTTTTGTNDTTTSTDSSSVTETAPANTAINVPLNQKVVVTFSESMDASTLTTASFTVTGKDEAALVGTVVYDADSKTASFDPDRNFTASTVYTAMITTQAKTATGTALASNVTWSFTSGAATAVDTTAPTKVSTYPVDTATDVPINRNVTATFNEALDPATVSSSSFTLKQGTTAISGTVSYSNKVATFDPTNDLAASTTYTATISTTATDLVGNALAANLVWTFTTGATANVAKGPAPVNLRTAGDFVILTKTGITNVHTSAITGNIGASPITAAAMDNVFCTEITGTIYGANAAYTGSGAITCFKGDSASNTLVANAVLDMGTAYTDASGRTTPDFTELHAGDVSGQTLVPGLYKWGTNLIINAGNVTLNGGANDVWIFQIDGDIVQASNTSVLLTGGALAKNVFWQVAGGTGVSIDTNAVFEGVIMAEKAINVKTGATVNGRLLSQTEVTLQSNTVTQPAQ